MAESVSAFKQCVKGYSKTASAERLHYNDAFWRRGNDFVFFALGRKQAKCD